MIIDAIKSPAFGYVVSLMLGVALVVLAYPMCRGKDCMIVKAPPIHEVANTVYHIGSKCYTFETVQMDCPKTGAIEAFQVR